MNRAATLLLALPAIAAAQTTTAPANTHPHRSASTTFTIPAPSNSCPIGFTAEPGVGPGMVIVVNGDTASSQKLKLQLNYLTDPQLHPYNIVAAQITVHGLTAKGRIAPASSNPDDNTIAKQVDLALTIAPNHTASTAMLFQGFTSVRWITLDSLTYANGSTWHPAAHKSCSIVPNRYMAVANAATN